MQRQLTCVSRTSLHLLSPPCNPYDSRNPHRLTPRYTERQGETRGRALICAVGVAALVAILATGRETPETLHDRCVQTCAPAGVVYRGRWMCACDHSLAANDIGGRP